MLKKFEITGIDCANCASKLERNISKIKGINDVNINFLTEKLIYSVSDEKEKDIYEEVLKKVQKQSKNISLKEI
ncbi:MAG: cation transporter [Lachnospirales bacterium]